MRWFLFLAACTIALHSVQADIIYLREGGVYAGTIQHMDDSVIRMELSDGQVVEFQSIEVFRATDDAGKILYEGRLQPSAPLKVEIEPSETDPVIESAPLQQINSVQYKKVLKFPLWPVLGGTAILGYFGVSQLSKSADTYDESKELEELGMEFSDTRDRSQKQRNWGQICIAGAVACLITGLTPRWEKVPVHGEISIHPTDQGIALSIHF